MLTTKTMIVDHPFAAGYCPGSRRIAPKHQTGNVEVACRLVVNYTAEHLTHNKISRIPCSRRSVLGSDVPRHTAKEHRNPCGSDAAAPRRGCVKIGTLRLKIRSAFARAARR